MTKADRDRSIERLLRSPQPDGAADDACPDAETLAALADRTLEPAERRGVEAHVADCHLCQMTMAAFARTGPAAGTAADETAPAFSWWKRRPALNWLATAAAAATAIAIWVAVPGQRAPQSVPVQSMAQPPAAAPSGPLQTTTLAEATPPAESGAAALRDAPQAPASRPPAENFARAEAKVEAGTADAVAKSAVASEGALGRTAPAQREDDSRERLQENAATPTARALDAAAATPPPARAAAEAKDGAGLAAGVFDVRSPDPRIWWRVGPVAAVQRTPDNGVTWTPQPTGVSTTLTAGSAPSASVCWLVGRAGTVLRTTDGGARWELVTFPESADLTAVAGSSALTATVDLAGGRRLGTTDGGRTWAEPR